MKLKYVVACGVLGLAATILMVPVYIKTFRPPYQENPIYITAAHINPDDIPGYKCIYTDTDRDTAYYLKEDYEYHYPEIGSTVYFGNSKGTVESIKQGVGFFVQVDKDTEVYKGLSGARVSNANGKDIAFISSAKGRDKLLCVSLY